MSSSPFWFYHKVFSGFCAFFSSVFCDICFLLSAPPLVFFLFHAQVSCPDGLRLYFQLFLLNPQSGLCLFGRKPHCVLLRVLMVSCLAPFGLPVVASLSPWGPSQFHLLCLDPHLSGSPSFQNWPLGVNLSFAQHLESGFFLFLACFHFLVGLTSASGCPCPPVLYCWEFFVALFCWWCHPWVLSFAILLNLLFKQGYGEITKPCCQHLYLIFFFLLSVFTAWTPSISVCFLIGA